MSKREKKSKTIRDTKHLPNTEAQKLPFIEHVYELRKRLFYIVASISVFSLLAYSINRQIINALLGLTGSLDFTYTSSTAGIFFIVRICFYVGIAVSIPVVVYQFLRYMEPLFKKSSIHFTTRGSLLSGTLALAGILLGYYFGLPTVLNFVLKQFLASQTRPLPETQAYITFTTMYLLGAALLFQIPLILIFINRIKPQSPKKLVSIKVELWVILGTLIGSFIVYPNLNLLDQAVIVGPLILMYQLGVGIIWFGQRNQHKPEYLNDLLRKDSELQTIRLERFQEAQKTWENTVTQKQIHTQTTEHSEFQPTTPVAPAPQIRIMARPSTARPRTSFSDFRPSTRSFRPTPQRINGIT